MYKIVKQGVLPVFFAFFSVEEINVGMAIFLAFAGDLTYVRVAIPTLVSV